VLLGFVRVRKSREYKKVPFPLSPRRQLIAALNLCVSNIKNIKNISLSDKIVAELSDQTKQKIYKREKKIKEQIFEIVDQRVNIHYR
jgi:ribosomal protein S7